MSAMKTISNSYMQLVSHLLVKNQLHMLEHSYTSFNKMYLKVLEQSVEEEELARTNEVQALACLYNSRAATVPKVQTSDDIKTPRDEVEVDVKVQLRPGTSCSTYVTVKHVNRATSKTLVELAFSPQTCIDNVTVSFLDDAHKAGLCTKNKLILKLSLTESKTKGSPQISATNSSNPRDLHKTVTSSTASSRSQCLVMSRETAQNVKDLNNRNWPTHEVHTSADEPPRKVIILTAAGLSKAITPIISSKPNQSIRARNIKVAKKLKVPSSIKQQCDSQSEALSATPSTVKKDITDATDSEPSKQHVPPIGPHEEIFDEELVIKLEPMDPDEF